MPEMRVNAFIEEWNEVCPRFLFAPRLIPKNGRPSSISVRYSAAKYHNRYSTDEWNRLCNVVEAKSHGTMFVVSTERMYENGVVEIAVAAANHNYQDRLVIGVLRWIAEGFFGNPTLAN